MGNGTIARTGLLLTALAMVAEPGRALASSGRAESSGIGERQDDVQERLSSARSLKPPTSLPVRDTAPASREPRYDYFDTLLEPGNTSTFPGSADTLTQDVGGYRSWLADRNMSFRAIGNVNMTYNPLNTGQPRSPQRYNGQRPTLNTSSQNFEITYLMDAVGLPDTMLFFGINNTFTSFYPNGPSSNYVRNFGIYQTFLHGKLTVKAGITPNYYEYVGMFAGGSPILSAGIPGLLPVQAGLGADPANVPLINVTGYGSDGKYIRVGVQRSTSVRGLPDEVLNRRGRFFNFTLKDAGPLYIGEIGVRRPATSNSKQIWLRAGGFFNDSRYRRFDGRGTSANANIYAAADRQITQPDQLAPGRGVYVGASAFWIPQSVNSSTESIEARVYSIGMAASRPKDTLSLRFIWTQFSDDAREAQRLAGMHANRSQVNASLSYSARLTHGVYATPGLTYVHNPSFVGDFKDAAVMSLAVFLII